MHIVKCVYCQENIDKDKEKYQEVRYHRYAHLTCHEPRVDADGAMFNMIIQYCGEIFGKEANFPRIGKQIKEYATSGMTYNGIYLTLKYWYEVKKNDISKSKGGIGIVPYIYKEARDYWKTMEPKRIPKMEEEVLIIKPKKRQSLLERMGG